jgi:phosphopantetheinyl transferase
VDLYLASAETNHEQDLAFAATGFIPASKLARIMRCQVAQQRTTMLLAEVLLKWALQNRGSLDLPLGKRGEGRYGKPFFQWGNEEGSFSLEPDSPNPIEFNISHSGQWALVGIDNTPIGVDIQEHRAIDDNLARKVLPKTVYRLFRTVDSNTRDALFCDYWARRESELKWFGFGIGGLPDTLPTLPKGIIVRNTQAPQGFSAAVCARGSRAEVAQPQIVFLEQLVR